MKYLFTIAGVIQSLDNQLYCYDTSFRTYQEALEFDDAKMKLIVIVEAKKGLERKYLFVDMNKLLSKYLVVHEYVHFHVTCWPELLSFLEDLYDYDNGEAFNEYLTESPVPRYMHYKLHGEDRTRITPFPSNMNDSIKIVSLGYTQDIHGSYVNKDFPKIRDLPHRRINLPDLVFTKKDTLDMDFRNTIPSVDGVVCYPIYSEETEELYACNGARMLKNSNYDASLNILLMDFSKMGDLTFYKLSDCRPELIIRNGNDIWVYDDPNRMTTLAVDPDLEYWQQSQFTLKFYLPEGATQGEPLLSLAGRLFMKGMDDLVTYTDDNGRVIVEFHITSGILENIVAANLQHQNLFYKKTTLFRVIMSYVFGNIFLDQAHYHDRGSEEWVAFQFHLDQIIPFVAMVHMHEGVQYGIDKVEPLAMLCPGKLLFPPHARGLLMNTKTREFVDYVRIPYKDQTLVTTVAQPPLHISRREGGNTNNDPRTSDEVTYAEMTAYAPSDLVVDYNVNLSAFTMTTQSENTIWGRSVNNTFELLAGAAKMYNWATVTEGLTDFEKIPAYVPSKNIWVLKKDGLVYAVSETDLMDYTSFDWEAVADIYPVGRTYANILSVVRPLLVQTVVDGTHWSIVNRSNQILAYTEVKTNDNPVADNWFMKGSTTPQAYSAVETACRDEEERQLRKVFNQEDMTWELVDDETGVVYARTGSILVMQGSGDNVQDLSRYTNLQWKKLLPSNDSSIRWIRIVDGQDIVPDNVKMDRIGWEESPHTFESPYRETPIGEILRDTRQYALIDIDVLVPKKDTDNLLPDPDPEVYEDPAKHSLTYEKVPFGSSINLAEGEAPALTAVRVEPLIQNGQISTVTLVVRGAARYGSRYTKFDGNYVLTVDGEINTDRVWRSVTNSALTIKYAKANGSTPARWAIYQNNSQFFVTDKATKGSSPYNTSLTWRLRNA